MVSNVLEPASSWFLVSSVLNDPIIVAQSDKCPTFQCFTHADVRGSRQQFALTKLLMNMQAVSSVQEMHNSETATSASP